MVAFAINAVFLLHYLTSYRFVFSNMISENIVLLIYFFICYNMHLYYHGVVYSINYF